MANMFSVNVIKNAWKKVAAWTFDPIGAALGLNATTDFVVASVLEPWKLGSPQQESWKRDWSKIKHWITPDMRRDRELMTNVPNAPRRIVYGTCRVSGQLAYIETSGNSNKYLHMIMILAGHEVEGFGDIYLDDKLISTFEDKASYVLFDGTQTTACAEMVAASLENDKQVETTYTGNVVSGMSRIGGLVSVNGLFSGMTVTGDGIPTNTTVTYVGDNYVDISANATGNYTASTYEFKGASQRWTEDHKLLGVAYIYLKLTYSEKKFPSGMPKVTVVVKGKKVYDPRTLTTGYSNNPALCARDYMLMESRIGGMGCEADEIDESLVITAANVCEEQVVKNEAGDLYENRYECNGTIAIESTPKQIIDSIIQSMLGTVVYSEGVWKMYAGCYDPPASIPVIDESWLNGAISFSINTNKSDRINTIKGSFIDPTNNWSLNSFPIITSSIYKTEDGGEELATDITLNFTTSIVQTQRLGKTILQKSRLGLKVSYPCNFKAFKLDPHTIVKLNNTKLGWTEKIFRVMDWQFSPEGGVNLSLAEENAYVYNWSVGDVIPLKKQPPTSLPDPTLVLPPLNVTAVPSIYDYNNGANTRVDVKVSWNASELENVKYHVRYKIETDLTFSPYITTNDLDYTINSLSEGTYVFEVRVANSIGAESTWTAVNGVYVPNCDTVVPNVTGLEVFNQGNDGTFVGKDVVLRWFKVSPRGNVEAYGPAGEMKPEAWFRYYELLVYDSNDILRRTEYLTTESYTYTHEKNHADGLGTPLRDLKFSIRALSTWGVYSAIPAVLSCSNPAPAAPTVTGTAGFKSFYIKVDVLNEIDIEGYSFFASQTNGFIPDITNLVSKGNNTQVLVTVSQGGTWYFKACAYDSFGEDLLNYSTQGSVTIVDAQILPDDLYTGLRTDFLINNVRFYFGDDGLNPTAGTETTLYWDSTSGSIIRNDEIFTVTDGSLASANNQWIIATLSAGAATFSKAAYTSGLPTLENNQIIVAYTSATANSAGNYICYVRQANSVQLEGANIRDLTVKNAAIESLTTEKIVAGTALIGNALIEDLNANKITAGTITGSTLQTASTGKRFVVSTSDNQAHFYGDRGDGTVEDLCSIGITNVSGDNVIISVGSANNSNVGFRYDGSYSGVIAVCSGSGVPIQGKSVDNASIIGNSTNSFGVLATSTNDYGIYCLGGISPLRFALSSSSSAPTHVAANGCFWATSDGTLYYRTQGIWKLVNLT